MINESRLTSTDFKKVFSELEESCVGELEDLLLSRLMENKSVVVPGTDEEILEFAGRTNYKIRLKRPNKNVWSITFQEFRESIRKVLRKGRLDEFNGKAKSQGEKGNGFDLPTQLLLHVLPNEEYRRRSFVGNTVVHPTMGEGAVVGISDSGNVEVEFQERVVMLKPGFVKLKKSD